MVEWNADSSVTSRTVAMMGRESVREGVCLCVSDTSVGGDGQKTPWSDDLI